MLATNFQKMYQWPFNDIFQDNIVELIRDIYWETACLFVVLITETSPCLTTESLRISLYDYIYIYVYEHLTEANKWLIKKKALQL